jgi:hypothetical protein
MPSTEPDIPAIVADLTPEQREWITSPERFENAQESELSNGDPVWDALAHIGVADYWTDRLTKLGLTVLAALRSTAP